MGDPAPAPPPPARRWLWLVVGSLLLAGTAFATWWGYRGYERQAALPRAQSGRFPEPAPRLARLLARPPNDVPVVEALARSHLDAGDDEAARPALDRWCLLRPDDPKPLRL